MNRVSIVHISDTHNDYSFKTGSGDILIHSGDATYSGTLKEIQKLRDYFLSVSENFKHIIFTPGNHDFMFEKDFDQASQALSSIPNLKILINENIEILGIKFFFSPYSDRFGDWCFMDTNDNLSKIWNKINPDTDVVVTHGPAFGELDYCRGQNVGSNSLKWKLEQIKPKAHLFGHIHECHGIKNANGIWYINSALGPTLYPISEQFAHKIIIDSETKQIISIEDVE